MKKLKIGFIGNFKPPHSTENDRKWSFEKLGHEVITYQENETSTQKLFDDIAAYKFDVLFYSHTHDWNIPNLKSVFDECFDRRIPTASVHLDRWAWLAREDDMGREATWFTEYLFMADYSPEAVALYKKLGHEKVFYIKPGVVERDCYIAEPDPTRFPHEIVFVGSKGYHPEYPERPSLIDFLHREYGNRFGHYGNDGIRVVRGDELNTLYATAKIAVGDSCFGGRPNYVSDRYYETRGRGGFLLHPPVSGVDETGVGFYNPRHLAALKDCIDFHLVNQGIRESMRLLGHEHVKKNETYTNRAEEMLGIIFDA